MTTLCFSGLLLYKFLLSFHFLILTFEILTLPQSSQLPFFSNFPNPFLLKMSSSHSMESESPSRGSNPSKPRAEGVQHADEATRIPKAACWFLSKGVSRRGGPRGMSTYSGIISIFLLLSHSTFKIQPPELSVVGMSICEDVFGWTSSSFPGYSSGTAGVPQGSPEPDHAERVEVSIFLIRPVADCS